MSVESAKAFLVKLSSDENFRNQLLGAPDDAARQEIAKANGFEFTKAELQEVTGLDPDKELSAQDLDQVAGGMSEIGKVGVGAGVEVGVEAGVAAVAAAI